jgi:MoxR-like ATPase
VTVLERTTGAAEATLRQVTDAPTIAAMIELTRRVPAASHVLRHAVDLVVATQPGSATIPPTLAKYVRFGASPRGAQALILAAKVRALLDGRPSASSDDVRAVAPAALRHRLVVGYEAVADGVSADDLIGHLLDAVRAPGAGVRGAGVPAAADSRDPVSAATD